MYQWFLSPPGGGSGTGGCDFLLAFINSGTVIPPPPVPTDTAGGESRRKMPYDYKKYGRDKKPEKPVPVPEYDESEDEEALLLFLSQQPY